MLSQEPKKKYRYEASQLGSPSALKNLTTLRGNGAGSGPPLPFCVGSRGVVSELAGMVWNVGKAV